MMSTLCRTYHHDDLEALQRLMLELGYCVEPGKLRTNISEIYQKGGEIFVAERNGITAGCVCVVMDVRLAEGVYAEIVSLIVSDNAQGKGIGKKLIEAAEAWARKRVNKIRVRANVIRNAAHAFYKRQGYEEVKTQKIFIKRV